MKKYKGFTIVELLLTITALTILIGALAIVIDPGVELQKVRDTRRAAQVENIYGALEAYFAVNGTYPQGVILLENESSIEICASGVPQTTCQNEGLLYLSGDLEPSFISEIPSDSQAVGNTTGFFLHKNRDGQVGLSAPLVEFRDEIIAGASIVSGGLMIIAEGGDEVVVNDGGTNYQVHTFTSSGSLTLNEEREVEYLIIGGGGGGGNAVGATRSGGGGGAGGVLTGTMTLSAQTYTVTIGAGGDGSLGDGFGSSEVGDARSGEDTTFAGLTAFGGGGGGNGDAGDGANGGSGGGAGRNDTTNFGLGTSGQGNSGGVGHSSNNSDSGAGGGGGAGGPGVDGVRDTAGAGGPGISSSISGAATFYAGGGGGAIRDGNGGTGGLGGGGAGATSVDTNGGNGSPNTGSGGGGAGSTGNGGNGGSGIVIIRYPIEN